VEKYLIDLAGFSSQLPGCAGSPPPVSCGKRKSFHTATMRGVSPLPCNVRSAGRHHGVPAGLGLVDPVFGGGVAGLYIHQAKFEAGLVHFPRTASYLPELKIELLIPK
jgi:hypothetical protein